MNVTMTRPKSKGIKNLPMFKMKQSSPFVPSNKVGRVSKWEKHFQMISSKVFKVLTTKTLRDSEWGVIDLSVRDSRGVDKLESRKQFVAFRTSLRNRFATQEAIKNNKYGVYAVIHPDERGQFILRVAKIAINEEEVVGMFRNGGRGKGRLKQVLTVRTFAR